MRKSAPVMPAASGALHQGTANIPGVKPAWQFAISQIAPGSPAARIQERVTGELDLVLERLQRAGQIRAVAGLLAARVVDTLLHGLASERTPVVHRRRDR